MHDVAPRAGRTKVSLLLLFSLLAWLAISYGLGIAGVFAKASYLVPVFALAPPLLAMRAVTRSRLLSALVDGLPHPWIIGIQVYRLLGIIFLVYWAEGQLPTEFALPSAIGDIIVGLLAPLCALLVTRPATRVIARVWNYIGITDLVLAVTMGAITAPTLVQLLAFDAPNQLILSHPLVSIPTFAVPFGLLLHLVSLRKLRTSGAGTTAATPGGTGPVER